MSLNDFLASDAVLDRAYAWLCEQQRRWPDAADVWSFQRDWTVEKARLRAELRSGRFTSKSAPEGLLPVRSGSTFGAGSERGWARNEQALDSALRPASARCHHDQATQSEEHRVGHDRLSEDYL